MTDTKLEILIEDYQRRIRSATTIIEDPATSQGQRERVLVKLGEYKAFLRDLESLESSVPTPKGNGMTDAERMNRAKAWCFDNGISLDRIKAAWDKAVEDRLPIVTNLSEKGLQWWWLPPHLLEQLVKRKDRETA